jgi:cytochrome P450
MRKAIDAPGPRGLPLAGVAFQFRRDPLRLLMSAVREFGDVVQLPLLRLPLTPLEPRHRVFIVNHPGMVRHICLTHRDKYRTHQQLVEKLKLVLGLQEGELLTSVGDEWMQRKTTLQPAFSTLENATDKIVRSVQAMLNRWDSLPDGAIIDGDREMTRLTTSVFATLFLSLDLDGEDSALAPYWCGMLAGFSRRMAAPLKILLRIPSPSNRDFHQCLGVVEQRLTAVIADHQSGRCRYNDLLSAWVDVTASKGACPHSARSVRDQLMMLLLAGRKNVSNALAWACHLLGGSPTAAERLAAEAEDAPGSGSYTAAVQKEVLRLYPTAWLIARCCLEDDQLGGYHIPQGATIFMSPYAMHRNPAYWPDAERFDPDRFLGERQKQITADMYLPFGVGARTCIGNSITELIMRIALAMIFARFRMELPPGHKVRMKASSSLSPDGGLPVILRRWRKSR